jgi:acetyl-CoA carboxylase biotin carboxyl carrier protein
MDLSKIKDLKDLQALLDLMGRYDLEELELESEGQKIRLRKAGAGARHELFAYPAGIAVPPVAAAVVGAPATLGSAAGAAPTALPANIREVTSPMVGTFYRASSPEAEPFVKEGDSITPEHVVCIIEAMKVMNEIPAGIGGIVREILLKNGESVEFGQPLLRIEIV